MAPITITPSLRKTTYNPVTPTTAFPVNFPLFDNADLLVTVNDVERADYTVSGTYVDGVSTNAVVNMDAGVTGEVIIYGKRAPARTDQFSNGPLPINNFNYALNRLTIENQEARRDIDQNASDIAQEIEDREDAVAAEAAARESADAVLTTGLISEILAREAGDLALASLIGQAGPIEAQVYDSRAAVALAHVKLTINTIRTGGFLLPGDGGHALYSRAATEPAHEGKVQSLDGAWWEMVNIIVSPRQFGAMTDGTDAASAIERAVKFSLIKDGAVYLDGHFTVLSRITISGAPHIFGGGRDVSKLIYPDSAADFGFDITPSSYDDCAYIHDFSVSVALPSANNVFNISWNALGLAASLENFSDNLQFYGMDIRGVDSGTFNNGLWCDFASGVKIHGNLICNQADLSGVTAASFPMQACIYFHNDQATYNTVNARIWNNELLGAQYPVYVMDVEGVWFHDNDCQVCWYGPHFINTFRKINQYRIYANHIGVYDVGVKVKNARHVLITDNEFSYRIGRTDTATIRYITVEQVQFGEASGNTVRGNYGSVGTVTLDGVYCYSSVSADPTIGFRVSDNTFTDLMTAILVDGYVTQFMHAGNTFSGTVLVATVTNTSVATSTEPFKLGNGSLADPSGQLPGLQSSAKSGMAGVFNRDTDGGLVGFYRSATLVGNISITSSATTYNTSSDSSLKEAISDYDLTEAIEKINVIQIRNYTWTSTGEAGVGVFAQELYEVWPAAVQKGYYVNAGEESETDTDGAKYVPWSVDYSKLVPLMIAAIQKLSAQVAALESASASAMAS